MTSEEIARDLLAELRSGKLSKIGMAEITAAVRKAHPQLNGFEFDRIQERVLRKVVEGAAY